MLADDLGYANVGWHNPAVKTPSLDALVAEGLRLERHYVFQFCSPSRASLMTGRYPIHVQERMGPYWTTYTGPPLNMTLLPAKLREAGYLAHHVGKWHLGAYSREALAVGRGFHTSFGFLDGMEDHWNHRMQGCNTSGLPDEHGPSADLPGTQWGCWGNALPLETCDELSCYANLSARFDHDLWRDDGDGRGGAPARPSAHNGVFSQDMYEAEIIKILRAHPADVPLFLCPPLCGSNPMLAHQLSAADLRLMRSGRHGLPARALAHPDAQALRRPLRRSRAPVPRAAQGVGLRLGAPLGY